jgi:M6 family metalloprotease-like protein
MKKKIIALLTINILGFTGYAYTHDFPVPPVTGTAVIPVILINFADTTTSYTPEDFEQLLFSTGTNSMKDYYEEVSYGVFSVSSGPSGIAGWYEAVNNRGTYGSSALALEAVQYADSFFNYDEYDWNDDCYVEVSVVHQGHGREETDDPNDIKSESGTLSYNTNDPCTAPGGSGNIQILWYTVQPELVDGSLTTIGVYAHEYGHMLGIWDLYDPDYSSSGIGKWGLMGKGTFNGVTRTGDSPAHLSPWHKIQLGWVTPVNVDGVLTDEPIEQASAASDVYQFSYGEPGDGTSEYFLVENRQKTGFDAGLPGDGLLIWHIAEDGNKYNECYPGGPDCAAQHYKVALVQADNLWHLEQGINKGDSGDPYPGSTSNTSFTDSTSPGSSLYSGAPSGVSVTDISASGPVMTATLALPCTYADYDNDTYTSCGADGIPGNSDDDCDDSDAGINPGVAETWYDGVDQDCDGWNDYDQDMDTYIDQAYDETKAGGTSPNTGDCYDNDPASYPGAAETWYDGVDQDCDGWNDYDQDMDTYVKQGYDGEAGGTSTGSGDCIDTDSSIYPGAAEVVADGIDQDCNRRDRQRH